MNIIIRQAKPEDSEKAAPLIIQAIGVIVNHMTELQEPDAVLEKVGQMICGENTH